MSSFCIRCSPWLPTVLPLRWEARRGLLGRVALGDQLQPGLRLLLFDLTLELSPRLPILEPRDRRSDPGRRAGGEALIDGKLEAAPPNGPRPPPPPGPLPVRRRRGCGRR